MLCFSRSQPANHLRLYHPGLPSIQQVLVERNPLAGNMGFAPGAELRGEQFVPSSATANGESVQPTVAEGGAASKSASATATGEALDGDVHQDAPLPLDAAVAAGTRFAELMRLESLRVISLRDCGIRGGAGTAPIAAALRKSATLQVLNLWGNPLGSEGACALLGALERNSTLRALGLGHVDACDDTCTRAAGLVARRQVSAAVFAAFDRASGGGKYRVRAPPPGAKGSKGGKAGAKAAKGAAKGKGPPKASPTKENEGPPPPPWEGPELVEEEDGSFWALPNTTLRWLDLSGNSSGPNGARVSRSGRDLVEQAVRAREEGQQGDAIDVRL